MPAGRWGDDERRGHERLRSAGDAWADDLPDAWPGSGDLFGGAGDVFGEPDDPGAPRGASSFEELAHRVALEAALDAGHPALSPTAAERARMQDDFFARLDAEWPEGTDGPAGGAGPDADERVTEVLPGGAVPAPAEDATRVDGTVAASVQAASTDSTRILGERARGDVPRGRRARHSLPKTHPDHPDNASRPGTAGGSRRPGRPSLRRRVAVVGGAALLALVALTGGGALFSQDALPGDPLYAMKLMSESTGTAFAFGDSAKAQRHLAAASTRLDEARRLAAASSPNPQLLDEALASFDDSASAGARILMSGATTPDEATLDTLQVWAQTQAQRLDELQAALPAEAAAHAERSRALAGRIAGRAADVRARTDCSEVLSGRVDDLGAVPASGPCAPTSRTTDSGTPGTTQRSQAGTSVSPTAPSPTGSAPASPSGSAENGLLQDAPLSDVTNPSGTSSTAPSTTSDSLLPPVTVPPLLPGGRGVSLG